MAVERVPDDRRRGVSGSARGVTRAFRETADRIVRDAGLDDVLQGLAAAIAEAAHADQAIVRVLDGDSGSLVARYVWAPSPSAAAELIGTRIPREEAVADEASTLRRPVLQNDEAVASIELHRVGRPFEGSEAALLELAALYAGLALHVRELEEARGGRVQRERVLDLAGEALAAGVAGSRTAEQVTRLAAEATGASSGLLWRSATGGELEVLASHRMMEPVPPALEEAAARALGAPGPVAIDRDLPGVPEGIAVATLRLGSPPLGSLQLLFTSESAPGADEFAALTGFAVRAAHALRAGETIEWNAAELERTRALVAVVGQTIARLSLAHTLETAVDRLAELLGIDRLAVYLREGTRLRAVAEKRLTGPHTRVAEALLELALGPYRARDSLAIGDAAADPALARVRAAVKESGIEAAIAAPLVAHEEVIGMLAVYPPRKRTLDENEAALVSALAPQLAVAVENARLHEQAKELGSELETALQSERQAARHLRALYEISRSFTQSLSLDATLEAITKTIVEALGVDAAAVRMLDARGEALETRSIHVAHEHMIEGFRAILSRPHPVAIAPVQRVLRSGEPLVLDARAASNLPGHEFLAPFLEKGSTAVILPVATPVEVVATVTLVSLDATRPITGETIAIALSIAGQAALAIDNARLYQQQKGLADTMQRALLARAEPDLEGLDLGAVYESSARVEVGGDIYDFAQLDDGRLAVVLGDVTGHGIEAAADMAMAKYVFRSLCREHPDPGDFLASANEVVLGELVPGKFITMLYLTVDPSSGFISCASAGHPAPRLLHPDGTVTEIPVRGLPLGIEEAQAYEEAQARLEPGSALVLHTDGVVEARRGRELYGRERLDRTLAKHSELDAKALAGEVLAASRAFAGGELPDDCAVVVIRRTG